ncbi:hypothetical protein POM88_040841 [Heracleum sosnowskyi]|uniref:F-box associated beta-propeller type 3 domain-containing protein n=1 Tax=Heracleum sosnowskyi TaxID=360622 RepID=A0AAD8M7Q8_9APIA|nr:hypothetical protein POM88_040841 [Heracleum sosnowskyi]
MCKLWLSIISDPNFIESHRHCAIISAPTPTLLTILNPALLEHQPFSLLYDDYFPTHRRKQQLVYKALDDARAQDLSKSSVHFRRVVLPSLFHPAAEVVNYCFGYDFISDDYKVVMIYGGEPLVQVYSTKSNSLKEYRPFIKNNFNAYYSGPNLVLKGVLYFDAFSELLSFDLHKDVFGLVPFPSRIKRKRSGVLDFKGSVAVVFESE